MESEEAGVQFASTGVASTEEGSAHKSKCPFAGKMGKGMKNPHTQEEGSEDCFHKEGCPFADVKELDAEALKNCPAFKDGCPYAAKDFKNLKDCPAFKVSCY